MDTAGVADKKTTKEASNSREYGEIPRIISPSSCNKLRIGFVKLNYFRGKGMMSIGKVRSASR